MFPGVAKDRVPAFDGLGRSSSVRESPTPKPSSGPNSFRSDSDSKGQRKSFAGNATHPFANYDSSDDSVEEVPKSAFKPRQTNPSPKVSPNSAKPSPKFGVPPGGTFPTTKSRSAESINLKFRSDEWNGKFEGYPDYFGLDTSKAANSRGRNTPTRGRSGNRDATSQTKPAQAVPNNIPPPPPFPPPFTTQASKFTPQEWQKTFRDPAWAFPAKETSPRRGSAPPKRPKGNQRKTSPTRGIPIIDLTGSANGSDKAPPARPKHQAHVEDAIDDSDAMDIDTDLEPKTQPERQAKEPSKSARPNHQRSIPSLGSEGGVPLAFAFGKTGGLDGLNGLKNVEPLAQKSNGEGLSGLNDIGSFLPFESRPSNVHPTKSTRSHESLPSLPMAPEAPDMITASSLKKYLNQMAHYFTAWQKFDGSMVAHFKSREENLRNYLDPDWLRNTGEKTNTIGLDSYLKWLDEDERMQETWRVARDKHKKAMLKCKEVRHRASKELPKP